MRRYGLQTAAHALRYWENRQQVAAHNLANVDTRGFKGERVFARLIDETFVAAETETDYRPGSLTQTGNPLDLALDGPGYFVLDTPDGERLTRGGSQRVDEGGTIVDAAGHPLLGEDWTTPGGLAPIVVPPGQIEIDPRGLVRVDGHEVGQIRIETVAPGTQLQRDPAGRFVPDAVRTTQPAAERGIRQGYLEESNVNAIESLVELINVQRAFASVQNTVRVIDGMMDTIANQIGRV
jgi:flagellar basal body rod protein FlgG